LSYQDPNLKLFSCNSNPKLAADVSRAIGVSLGNAKISRFSDGEIRVELHESVRGCDVYIIQSTSSPVNDHLMEMLVMIDALKRASAKTINVVIPYYGYARQDRKAKSRDPITAKLVADLITASGANRVITLDLHATQIQGFFNIPVDNLHAVPIIAKYFLAKQLQDIVVVSPDHGGVVRARKLAEKLKAPLAIIDKRRPEPNVSEVMNIIGDVSGKTTIIIDDIIDTAGTIVLAAEALRLAGARSIYAACTHPVLSGMAIDRLEQSVIQEIVITDSIPFRGRSAKFTVLSVAELLAKAVIHVHENISVSVLFETV
jgi:ribose-phosphate pyrophosphokinase